MVLAWLNSGEPYEAPKPTGKQLDGGKEEYRAEPPAEDADDDQPDPPAHRGSRSNGQRPYTGEAVMGKIIDFAAAYQEQLGDTPASKSLCQMLAASLDKAFGDRDRRLAVTGFVSGFGSTGDDENGAWQSKVKTYQAKAYLKWLGIPDGGWEPSGPYWQDEAKNLYAYVVQSMEARE